MTIQPIGTAGAALFCTSAELSAYGFSPAALTAQQALLLLREASRPAGLLPDAVAELEVFPNGAGVLIFVRLRPAPAPRSRIARTGHRGRIRRGNT